MRHVDTLNSCDPLLTRTTKRGVPEAGYHIHAKHHYSEDTPQTGRRVDGLILRPYDSTPVVFQSYDIAASAIRTIQSCRYVCEPGEVSPPTLTIVPVE
jgi:hypothetical protein